MTYPASWLTTLPYVESSTQLPDVLLLAGLKQDLLRIKLLFKAVDIHHFSPISSLSLKILAMILSTTIVLCLSAALANALTTAQKAGMRVIYS